MDRCRLCGEYKKLCESHIIPDFMHRDLFNEKHKIYKVALQNLKRAQILPTGEYEKLLCETCDNQRIGKLEKYASDVMYGGQEIKGKIIFEKKKSLGGVEFLDIKGIDYKKFKLFLLSILWRASISSRDFFHEVQLGPYEEKIRQMIFNDDPDDFLTLPCIILSYLGYKPNLPKDCIGQPMRLKGSEGTRYVFLIGGFLYFYCVSRSSVVPWAHETVINQNNEMKILHMTQEQGAETLNKFIGRDIFK